ncbi:MAG: 30S ribosomal protein S2 [bacterium]
MTITTDEVIKAQAHIGTLKAEAHPKTNKYWSEVVNGLVVINPESIVNQLEHAKTKIQNAKKDGKEVLIISEKKMYADELSALGEKTGISYLNYKFPGGFLTNFDTFKKRIESMNTMARFLESENYLALTKKEQLVYKRKLDRVFKVYKGVKNLSRKPDLVIVVDGQMMDSLINEINKTAVDNIIIAGTNFSRRWDEENIIVANIGSHKSLDFVMQNILS